jgi:hypothetical protein
MNCCIMLSLNFDLCLMHMLEMFTFEFEAWLDLNSKEKIKIKEISATPSPLSHVAQLSLRALLSLLARSHLSAPTPAPARAPLLSALFPVPALACLCHYPVGPARQPPRTRSR